MDVNRGIHARATAVDRTSGTAAKRAHAGSRHTRLTGGAGCSARTAIVDVSCGIHARATAAERTSGTAARGAGLFRRIAVAIATLRIGFALLAVVLAGDGSISVRRDSDAGESSANQTCT